MTTYDAVKTREGEVDDLRRENAYLRRLIEETTARLLTTDAQSIEIRHELEQKRRGFGLMAELAVTLGQETDLQVGFVSVSRRINATLNMQRTVILVPEDDAFRAAVLQGYSPGEREAISARRIEVDPELLEPYSHALVTGADAPDKFAAFRETLALPYFIAAPVVIHDQIAALLVTGRVAEQRPYLPRLGASDVESVRTVAAYLTAILTAGRLRQAEILAKHDPLTELPNRRGTMEDLHHSLAVARRGGFFVAALFIDLDGFKSINDTYGHATGDAVLIKVAERLKSCVRDSDLVGRIGGDEFLVVLSHVRRPRDAGLVARNIIDALGRPMEIGSDSCVVGASVGIAIFPDNGADESALIDAADQAMYAVKSAGKSAFAFAERKQPISAGGGDARPQIATE